MIPYTSSEVHRTHRHALDRVSNDTALGRSVRAALREACKRPLYRTCGQVDRVCSSWLCGDIQNEYRSQKRPIAFAAELAAARRFSDFNAYSTCWQRLAASPASNSRTSA